MREIQTKCDKCDEFDKAIGKQLDPILKDQFQLVLGKHIQEEKFDREQYYAARVKAKNNPHKYLSIIMDPHKTCVPFFLYLLEQYYLITNQPWFLKRLCDRYIV